MTGKWKDAFHGRSVRLGRRGKAKAQPLLLGEYNFSLAFIIDAVTLDKSPGPSFRFFTIMKFSAAL